MALTSNVNASCMDSIIRQQHAVAIGDGVIRSVDVVRHGAVSRLKEFIEDQKFGRQKFGRR